MVNIKTLCFHIVGLLLQDDECFTTKETLCNQHCCRAGSCKYKTSFPNALHSLYKDMGNNKKRTKGTIRGRSMFTCHVKSANSIWHMIAFLFKIVHGVSKSFTVFQSLLKSLRNLFWVIVCETYHITAITGQNLKRRPCLFSY